MLVNTIMFWVQYKINWLELLFAPILYSLLLLLSLIVIVIVVVVIVIVIVIVVIIIGIILLPGKKHTCDGQKHCLIMDEVDGMAGNEDRGGMAELIQVSTLYDLSTNMCVIHNKFITLLAVLHQN